LKDRSIELSIKNFQKTLAMVPVFYCWTFEFEERKKKLLGCLL
jgi:hypothetical protein